MSANGKKEMNPAHKQIDKKWPRRLIISRRADSRKSQVAADDNCQKWRMSLSMFHSSREEQKWTPTHPPL